jgi:hypothetical protein
MEGMVCYMEEVIDMEENRESMEEEKESTICYIEEGIVFWVEFAAFWVSLIECYGTCLRVRGFILFFILILIKINRKDL